MNKIVSFERLDGKQAERTAAADARYYKEHQIRCEQVMHRVDECDHFLYRKVDEVGDAEVIASFRNKFERVRFHKLCEEWLGSDKGKWGRYKAKYYALARVTSKRRDAAVARVNNLED